MHRSPVKSASGASRPRRTSAYGLCPDSTYVRRAAHSNPCRARFARRVETRAEARGFTALLLTDSLAQTLPLLREPRMPASSPTSPATVVCNHSRSASTGFPGAIDPRVSDDSHNNRRQEDGEAPGSRCGSRVGLDYRDSATFLREFSQTDFRRARLNQETCSASKFIRREFRRRAIGRDVYLRGT